MEKRFEEAPKPLYMVLMWTEHNNQLIGPYGYDDAVLSARANSGPHVSVAVVKLDIVCLVEPD